MKKVFEVEEYCANCEGTGIFVGFAEKDGAGVVCHSCDGTGCIHYVHEYEEFVQRKDVSRKIKRVYQVNPGVGIEENDECSLEDFGGMPIKEWEAGLPFPPKSENRKFTCPSWWYLSANYDLKPTWDACHHSWGRSFSECPFFKTKEKCWERFDKEHK